MRYKDYFGVADALLLLFEPSECSYRYADASLWGLKRKLQLKFLYIVEMLDFIFKYKSYLRMTLQVFLQLYKFCIHLGDRTKGIHWIPCRNYYYSSISILILHLSSPYLDQSLQYPHCHHQTIVDAGGPRQQNVQKRRYSYRQSKYPEQRHSRIKWDLIKFVNIILFYEWPLQHINLPRNYESLNTSRLKYFEMLHWSPP